MQKFSLNQKIVDTIGKTCEQNWVAFLTFVGGVTHWYLFLSAFQWDIIKTFRLVF